MPEEKKNVEEVVQPQEGADASDVRENRTVESTDERPKSEDKNWREVRDIMQHQKQKIAELEEKLMSREKPAKEEEDPFANLSDEDIVTVGDTKKLVASMAKRYASEIYQESSRKQAIDQVPSQFSDYNDVIKLVDDYVKENPAAEAAILASPNPRLTAYQLVKSSTMYQRQVASKNVSDDAKKALENVKKPMSSSSVGTTSPLNEAKNYARMTPDRAAEIRKLAEEYASRR